MEVLQQSLVSFLSSFMLAKTENIQIKDFLVRKMLRMRSVQKIIIESMCKLEPIINQEILSIDGLKVPSSTRNIVKRPKLLTLAEEIKNVMENYEYIQGKVTDMKNMVENIDLSVEISPEDPDFYTKNTSPGAAFSFLSSVDEYKPITNKEIEEISEELWSRHIEVERMLKVEVEKYIAEMDLLENKYFYKIADVKQKAGIKINNLENEIISLTEFFRKQIDQYGMRIEEQISRENERIWMEENIIKQNFDSSPVRDLPSALNKIRKLLNIKRIYEKRRNKDEKLIKGLNSKLQLLLDKFSELQESNSKLLTNFSSLSWCLGTVIESSNLSAQLKQKALKHVAKQNFNKLETMMKTQGIFELNSIEVITKKFDEFKDGIVSISSNLKDEGVKNKISKLVAENKIEDIRKNTVMKKAQIKSASPRRAMANRNRTPKSGDREKPNENAIDQLKQALINIDEEIKKNNKVLADDLEELVAEDESELDIPSGELNAYKDIEYEKRRHSANPILKRSVATSPNGGFNDKIHEKPALEHVVKNYETCYSQTLPLTVNSSQTQTSSQLFIKIIDHVSSFLNRGRDQNTVFFMPTEREIEDLITNTLQKSLVAKFEKGIQTVKDTPNYDIVLQDNSLIRGLMNKSQFARREKSFLERDDRNDNITIERFTNLPGIDSLDTLIDLKSPVIIQATEAYKKEFQIHTQLKGLKKLDFNDIQALWEKVINRRIIEGEKDKISIYLRGYLGTDRFEGEKKKVIEMIEAFKAEENSFQSLTPNSSLKPMRPFSEKALNNWKRLMFKFIFKKLFMSKAFDFYASPTDMLYEAAKKIKFVKHRINKTSKKLQMPSKNLSQDKFQYEKSEKWILNSITPTLVDTYRAKSRYRTNKRNYTADRLKRVKSPIRDKDTNQDSKFPVL